MEEKVRVVLEFSFEVPALANAILPRGADTYHDFRPACAVGVMRANSTPRHDMSDTVTGICWWYRA